MKLKHALVALCSLVATAVTTNAAQVALFNLAGGPGVDTLWSYADSTPMSTGTVSLGYFDAAVTSGDLSTIAGLEANLGTFTSFQSTAFGASDFAPGFDGYVANDFATVAPVLGRMLYAVATDGAGAYSVFEVGTMVEDVPFENSYVANPAGATIVLGTLGEWTGDASNGADSGTFTGTYTTLNLAAVPEPSAALLGALGMLGLLRRRRA